jgi:hypothetical protein
MKVVYLDFNRQRMDRRNWYLLVLIGLILLPVGLFAQNYPGLLKQTTNYRQMIPGDSSSWEFTSREVYSYNSRNQKTYENYQVWDQERKAWNITYESKRSYDLSGNRTYFWSMNYDTQGNRTREWESFREYSGDLRIESHIFSINHEDGHVEEMLINYEFDDKDRLYRTITEFWDNQNEHWKRISTSFFDTKGCVVAETEKETTYFIDRSYDVIDSTHTEYINDCLIKQKDYYNYIQDLGAYFRYGQYKIDYQFDNRNYIIQETHYEKNFDAPDWVPSLQYAYVKNDDGQPLSYHFVNFKTNFQNLDEYEYDPNGNVIYHQSREWDVNNGDWLNNYLYTAEYSSDSLRENYLFEYGWDKQRGDYKYYVQSESTFDKANLLIREVVTRLDINRNNQENYHFVRSWNYENRCDGQLLSVESSENESTNLPETFYPEKTENEYFDNAYCDPLDENENQLMVYPNPSNGEVNIYSINTFGDSEISLINAMGQQVYLKKTYLNNYFSLNMIGLPSGLYSLKINNGKYQYTEKILLIN